MRTNHDSLSIEKSVVLTLKEKRKIKKITQTELAGRIGVSRDTIARIESGKARVYLAQVVAIAQALDIMLLDLLAGNYSKTENDEQMDTSYGQVKIEYVQCAESARQPPVLWSNNVVEGGEDERNSYFDETAVESFGKPLKDFILNHKTFWWWVPEKELIALSIASVVEATLNYGQEEDLAILFEMIGVSKVSEIFKAGNKGIRSNYQSDVIAFFDAYFKRHVPGYSD